ncbi:MAG: hypothetical protein U0573_08490 [Phycisphaerales bacterium]|nr:hypothetical protein [Planctomycetota bacterium]
MRSEDHKFLWAFARHGRCIMYLVSRSQAAATFQDSQENPEMKMLIAMTDSRRKVSLLFLISFLAMC